MNGVLLLERLSDSDLALLAEAAAEPGSATERIGRLHAEPDRIDGLLSRPEVYDSLFGAGRREPIVVVAPFLAFSVLLARTTATLRDVTFVPEWVGPQRRVPVFDVGSLRGFLDDTLRRFFLADLLSSYTHVASGTVWVQTRRGWRRRRFSELDPVRLAELVEGVSEHERPLLWRRLGDLSLFLTGVFPDHASRRLLAPRAIGRLQRAVPGGSNGDGDGLPGGSAEDAIALLEDLGRRSYRMAWEATSPKDTGMAKAMGEVAERFTHARRVLNFVTDRFLFPFREQWFAS